MALAIGSDVAVFGDHSIFYEIERSRNTNLLSFELSERWLKRGILSFFSPRFLKSQWYYHTLFYKKPVYKLCASAYASRDQRLLHSFNNRCFKWGYFPYLDCGELSYKADPSSLMWCARFIKWKHPEYPILLAYRLKRLGYRFSLDLYGDGPELGKTKKLADRLKVNDVVFFHGFQANKIILSEMRRHHIFLFTSDKREGWGVVANEAMSNGCVLVADNEIGSTPYLVNDRITGCSYRHGSIHSLETEVRWLLDNENRSMEIGYNAERYIIEYWNPANAARSLIMLSDALLSSKSVSIKEGPCSKA